MRIGREIKADPVRRPAQGGFLVHPVFAGHQINKPATDASLMVKPDPGLGPHNNDRKAALPAPAPFPRGFDIRRPHQFFGELRHPDPKAGVEILPIDCHQRPRTQGAMPFLRRGRKTCKCGWEGKAVPGTVKNKTSYRGTIGSRYREEFAASKRSNG